MELSNYSNFADLEKLFLLLSESSNEIFFTFDMTLKCTYVSPNISNIIGYDDKSIIEMNIDDYITPDSLLIINHIFEEELKLETESGGSKLKYREMEIGIIHKNGKIINMELKTTLLRDSFGIVTGILGIAREISDHKLTEKKLHESEKKLLNEKYLAEKYLDIAEVMLIALDISGNIILMNKKGCDVVGCTEGDMIGKNWFENFIPKDKKDEVFLYFKKIINGVEKHIEFYENTIITKNGKEKLVAWRNTLLKDENGKIFGTLSSGQDITESKRMEEKLRTSEEIYRNLIENMTDGLVVNDENHNIQYINSRFSEMLNYSKEELVNKSILELFDEKNKNFFIEQMVKRKKGIIKPYEIDWTRKNGDKIHTIVAPSGMYDEHHNFKGSFGVVSDITERIKMEKALIESETRYRQLIEKMNEGMVVQDEKNLITYVNKKVCELLGYSAEELIGRSIFDFFDNKNRKNFAHQMEKRRNDINEPYEIELVKKNGEKIDIFVVPSSIFNDEGTFEGSFGVFTDITERNKIEKALRESETKFRNLFESVPTGLLFYTLAEDNELIFTGANPEAEKLLQLDQKQYIGKPIGEVFPGLIGTEIPDIYKKLAAEGGVWHDSQVIYDEGNITGAFEVQAFQTSPGKMVASFFDVTGKVQAEQVLRESEEKFRQLSEQSLLGILILHNLGIKYANDAAAGIIGYPLEEILTWTMEEYAKSVHPDDIEKIAQETLKYQNLSTVGVKSNDLTFRIITKTKEVKWIKTYAKSTTIEGKKEIYITMLDITKRKNAEEKLASRLRYEEGLEKCSRSLLKNSDDALNESIRHLMDVSSAERVFIFENFDDDENGLCTRLINGVSRDDPNFDFTFPKLQRISYNLGLKRWKKELSQGNTISGIVENFPEEEREIFEQIGILSMLILPIFVNNKWFGLIGFDHFNFKYDWEKDDINLLQTAAKMIGSHLERKKVEEALHESEEKYRTIVEYMKDYMIQMDTKTNFLFANKSFLKDLRYTQEDITNLKEFDLIHPEDLEASRINLNQLLQGISTQNIEIRIRAKNNQYRYFSSNYSPIFDDHGVVVAILMLARDVSEKKIIEKEREIAEHELIKAQMLLSSTITQNVSGIIVAETSTAKIQIVNAAALEILGIMDENIIGVNLTEQKQSWIAHYPDGAPYEIIDFPLIRALISGEIIRNEELYILRKDGNIRWVLINSSPLRDYNGKITASLCVFTDFTERKLAEEDLRRNEEKYRMISENASDVIITYDNRLKLQYVSPSVKNQFSYSIEEFKKLPFKNFLTPETMKRVIKTYIEADQIERKRLKEGKTVSDMLEMEKITDKGAIEGQAIDGNGKLIDVEISWGTLRGKNDKIIGILAVQRNITERKIAERKLEIKTLELERSNEDLQQFAYVASHDLKEPLRTVSGYLHLLERRYGNKIDEKAHKYISKAVNGTYRMEGLVNDILKLSQVGTQQKIFKPIHMDEVLGNTMINLKAIIDESGTEITYGNLPTILGDHSQMGQVLQNLINNAIKFQDAKIKPIVHIDCKEKEDIWVFSVKDNGIGIDNKHFHLLFKTFKRLHDRRKYEGSGIGLALCKKIIERHGGRIWVESVLGKGSTFLFTIPKL